MILERGDFAEFFAAVHDHRPFAWQERLLDTVLAEGWPDTIDAPTGAGKTAAIDVHVFALAFAALTGRPLPPRRLVMVVGRRVLVDDQYEHARALRDRLRDSTAPDIVRRVAAGLRSLAGPAPQDVLTVARLRGGLPPSRRWVDHPQAAAVLCATPEMWGSRLLFRGYGSSSRAWPREAGLLAADTVAVVDEAHLARQVLRTARRVAELVPVAEGDTSWLSPLRVVETTATPVAAAGRRVGVDEEDLARDEVLAQRMLRRKPVTLVPCSDWNRSSVVGELVRRVAALRAEGDRTVGCFVNSVERAVAVTRRLRETEGLTVALICGQVRPIDIARLDARYPGVLSTRGNDEVDVLVSTQSLEVGADLDFGGMVTELASGSALAQRAGRVNRLGTRETGPISVIVPDAEIRTDVRSGPYTHDDLAPALEWLARRAEDRDGLAPWALRGDPPPSASRRRPLWQRPELGHVWHWARTNDELAAAPELDLWLSEDFEPDNAVGVVVRDELVSPVVDPVTLVRYLPPRRHEVFGTPLRTARAALTAADRDSRLTGVLVRGDEVDELDWTETDDGRRPHLRPGDIVVLDSSTRLFTASPTHDEHTTPQVVVPLGWNHDTHTAEDVLEAPAELNRNVPPGDVVHRITVPPGGDLHRALTPSDEEPAADPRDVVTEFLATDTTGMAAEAYRLLTGPAADPTHVVVLPDLDSPGLVLVLDGRRATSDDDVPQPPIRRLVLLDNHQRDVGDRAAELAGRLGLPDTIRDVLYLAGLHHDDGKYDPRFQTRLGAPSDTILAKSRSTVGPVTLRRRHDASGLPPRWRHEQRSVVHSWPELATDATDGADRDLVARLIGTSHGHGRTGFPHAATDLLNTADSPETKQQAADLFDEGEWDDLIERTHHRYGVWVCSFLEAVLRAADGQISAEGK
ncbi:type I-G CRISPR-associated helicase/endonuclease Cas3g [Actinophytocola gossypii]|uniref:Type I-U CRISPR-associated helicase/endonuclease Cas3 n=1 Tax=Actinophytocola gossypii TaxID=2812003 RepID=A0ABT2JI58_9PSEU|nr:type I-U CRISPR-associated helicase/endonuclease Cas3 [Actinophytocola gossypii]MCT2587563.1 type I-U CRISPR-associated helicase/endonuclease Cas3 [Actinophytocola gossypii]